MLNLGIIGMSPGNGHPYSWSAIFNGYNKEKMAECPFPVIPEYLVERKPEDFGIDGAKVTHIWAQDREISRHVAESSLIPNVVENMNDMISEIVMQIDAFTSFKSMLVAFVRMLDSGKPSFDWSETVEMAKVVIAGRLSLKEKCRIVNLKEI